MGSVQKTKKKAGVRLNQIEAFVAVVEEGSFAAAGRLLGRDASVILRRMDALEARLGVVLLDRASRNFTLTDIGEAYLSRTRQIMDELATAETEVTEGAVTARGLLRILAPSMFTQLCVVPWLPAFLEQNPQLKLEIHHSEHHSDYLAEGFDLAIRICTDPVVASNVYNLFSFETVLFAAPSYLARKGTPDRLEDLQFHQCLGLTQSNMWPEWRLSRGDENATIRVSGQVRFDDIATMMLAAVNGGGILLASPWSSGPELANGRLVRVLPEWRSERDGTVDIVLPQIGLIPTKTKLFIDRIRAELTLAPWLSDAALWPAAGFSDTRLS